MLDKAPSNTLLKGLVCEMITLQYTSPIVSFGTPNLEKLVFKLENDSIVEIKKSLDKSRIDLSAQSNSKHGGKIVY
jgi:hypothetical protein